MIDLPLSHDLYGRKMFQDALELRAHKNATIPIVVELLDSFDYTKYVVAPLLLTIIRIELKCVDQAAGRSQ